MGPKAFGKIEARRVLAVLAIGAAAAVAWHFYSKPEKPKLKPTLAEIAVNRCVDRAYRSRVASSIGILKTESELLQKGQAYVETVIAQRRLQETYCLEFARCQNLSNTRPTAATEISQAFEECIHDEQRTEIVEELTQEDEDNRQGDAERER